VELRALDLHLAGTSGIVLFYLYLTPDTRVGNLSNPSVWEEALRLEIPVGSSQLTRVEGFRPLRLKPGNHGCAVAVIGSGTRYSDGISRGLIYEDGYKLGALELCGPPRSQIAPHRRLRNEDSQVGTGR
jgi:hypothetical protein